MHITYLKAITDEHQADCSDYQADHRTGGENGCDEEESDEPKPPGVSYDASSARRISRRRPRSPGPGRIRQEHEDHQDGKDGRAYHY